MGDRSYPLEDLFMVMATQNPIEQEGTYPLPEAQLDRFLLHVEVGYPSVCEDERRILVLNRDEAKQGGTRHVPAAGATCHVKSIMTGDDRTS